MSAQRKSLFSGALAIFIVLFFVLLMMLKGRMNSYLSQTVVTMNDSVSVANVSAYIDSAWNYSDTNKTYQVTFLEFGSKGCSACRRMESVLAEFREKYPEKVNVVFVNILLPENQSLMKYYGMAVIPTQILLNREGKEFFRHSGYISFEDLSGKIN